MKRNEPVGVFDVINAVVMVLIAAICVYPFIYQLAISLSDGKAVSSGQVFLLPKGFNLYSFRYIITAPRFGIARGFLNSVLYTFFGTMVSVLVTFMTAFVLTRKKFGARKIIVTAFMVTYVFEAGLIPTYITLNNLGLVNNPLVMIVPTAISTYLLIITRTFLMQTPAALEESASIDGANDFTIMMRIYFPISTPVIATIGLFYAVQRWNDFLTPLIFLQKESLKPLPLILYNFTVAANATASPLENIMVGGVLLSYRTLTAAIVILTVIPILLIYPFAQRYFTSGLLVGSVKE